MRNGLDVHHVSFQNDMDRLIRGLRRPLGQAGTQSVPTQTEIEPKGLVDRRAEFVEYRTFDTDVDGRFRELGLVLPDTQMDVKGQPPKDVKRNVAEAERYQQGILLRRETPRESHAVLGPRDPIKMLVAADRDRVPELVAERYRRMLVSPFTFLRGAATVMAEDLKNEPSAGIAVQACGDCHLMNFGTFYDPGGKRFFDINDFDETLPCIDFTVDLKRLAASVAVAMLDFGYYAERPRAYSAERARAAAATTVAAYRLRMAALAKLPPLEIWHSRIDLEQEVSQFKDRKLKKKFMAMTKTPSEINHPLISEGTRIADAPPVIYHWKDAPYATDKIFASYKNSLSVDSLRVFEQYTLRDTVIRAVGVGSVGTFCTISLFTSRDGAPLFLQVRAAGRSALECLGPKFDGHTGKRVVDGQRILQAAGDIFLGWADDAESGRHFYVRQLRNRGLGSIGEIIEANGLEEYARLCAYVLACAHARSADSAVIAGYIGQDDAFDDALSSFAMIYAARTQEDYDRLKKAALRASAEPAKRE
jgi:Uncharacterized protein conserved in bacteria (DUF2252)